MVGFLSFVKGKAAGIPLPPGPFCQGYNISSSPFNFCFRNLFFMSRRIINVQRRHFLITRIFFIEIAVIRLYSHYIFSGLFCVIFDDSEYCAEYIRIYR
jgi:hypothetical protein